MNKKTAYKDSLFVFRDGYKRNKEVKKGNFKTYNRILFSIQIDHSFLCFKIYKINETHKTLTKKHQIALEVLQPSKKPSLK